MQSELSYAITPVGAADAAALAQVHVQSWRETYVGILPGGYLARLSAPLHARRWRARLLRDDEVTLAAEGSEGLVGYCTGGASRAGAPDQAEITTLYVLERAQGLGLGRALLTAMARVLAARGATSLVIWVLRDNHPARAFYERLGGQLDGERGEPVAGQVVPAVAYRWADLAAWLEK